MAMKEELEFISVQADEDDGAMNTSYGGNGVASQGDDGQTMGSGWFSQSKHPVALFFHLLFKSAALVGYIFGSWFTSSFILIFVATTILLAFDFWTVKNISGRLLVGLRWWSYVREDGSNEWVFEALEDMSEIAPTDSKIFWYTIYGVPVVWASLLILAILRLKFEYVPIILVALFLNGANALGYYKCSSSAQERIRNMIKSGNSLGGLLENNMVKNWVVNSLFTLSGMSGNSAATAGPTSATSTPTSSTASTNV